MLDQAHVQTTIHTAQELTLLLFYICQDQRGDLLCQMQWTKGINACIPTPIDRNGTSSRTSRPVSLWSRQACRSYGTSSGRPFLEAVFGVSARGRGGRTNTCGPGRGVRIVFGGIVIRPWRWVIFETAICFRDHFLLQLFVNSETSLYCNDPI